MKKSAVEFINDMEQGMKERRDKYNLFELNFFFYNYELGKSRITFEGNDYLCFPSGRHMYYTDMSEEERKRDSEEFHVYLLAEEFVYVEDSLLKEEIVKRWKAVALRPYDGE